MCIGLYGSNLTDVMKFMNTLFMKEEKFVKKYAHMPALSELVECGDDLYEISVSTTSVIRKQAITIAVEVY